MSAEIQYADKTPHHVVAWAQEWADEATKHAGVGHFGTYVGHDPDSEHALDTFPTSKAEGDKLAAWSTQPEVMAKYAVDYVIWWQRIFNPEVAPYWREMRDRGGITQNHKDHNHDSFLATAPQSQGDWLDMATAEEVRQIVKEEIQKALGDENKGILFAMNDKLSFINSATDKIAKKVGAQ